MMIKRGIRTRRELPIIQAKITFEEMAEHFASQFNRQGTIKPLVTNLYCLTSDIEWGRKAYSQSPTYVSDRTDTTGYSMGLDGRDYLVYELIVKIGNPAFLFEHDHQVPCEDYFDHDVVMVAHADYDDTPRYRPAILNSPESSIICKTLICRVLE